MKIYYEPQEGWGEREYYYLHRVLHRMFFYHEKFADEISKMDTSKMSEKTKVLIKCVVVYYNNEFLFDKYENIKEIEKIQPLKDELVIDEHPLPEDNIYKKMNVVV